MVSCLSSHFLGLFTGWLQLFASPVLTSSTSMLSPPLPGLNTSFCSKTLRLYEKFPRFLPLTCSFHLHLELPSSFPSGVHFFLARATNNHLLGNQLSSTTAAALHLNWSENCQKLVMMTKLGWDGGGHKITGLPEEIIDSAKITTTTHQLRATHFRSNIWTFEQILRIPRI